MTPRAAVLEKKPGRAHGNKNNNKNNDNVFDMRNSNIKANLK
jgi:hypothetical protein